MNDSPAVVLADSSGTELKFYGIVDTGNSRATLLTANSVFTGTAIDVSKYGMITVSCLSDKVSAANGLEIRFSQDNSNWDIVYLFDLLPAVAFVKSFSAPAKYFQVKLTNGGTDQTYLRLQTILNVNPSKAVASNKYPREYSETISLAATGSSNVVDIGDYRHGSVQFVISTNTDSVGALSFQVSNDKSNWIDLAFLDSNQDAKTSISVLYATALNSGINWTTDYRYAKITYTKTSGGTAQTCAVYMWSKVE